MNVRCLCSCSFLFTNAALDWSLDQITYASFFSCTAVAGWSWHWCSWWDPAVMEASVQAQDSWYPGPQHEGPDFLHILFMLLLIFIEKPRCLSTQTIYFNSFCLLVMCHPPFGQTARKGADVVNSGGYWRPQLWDLSLALANRRWSCRMWQIA
jgi:hypothetical protein